MRSSNPSGSVFGQRCWERWNRMTIEFRDNLPYDPRNKSQIEAFANKLVNHTLREKTDLDEIENPTSRRGSFGSCVEYYFGIIANSAQEPDFPDAHLELKSTPVRREKSGKIVAKERLVITMINYNTVVNETLEKSTFLEKAKDILLVTYLYDKSQKPLDYRITRVRELTLPKEDLPTFKEDWETVVNKVRAGHAEDISSSDTTYLEACTKSSDSSVRRAQPFSSVGAKPRAWALKRSYMDTLYRKLDRNQQTISRDADEQDLGLLALVKKRFQPYLGKSEDELGARFGYRWEDGRKPKNLGALITRKILGVGEHGGIAEFEKADIKPRTIRLNQAGMPEESVSFPAFKYVELAEHDFEDSDFRRYLEQKNLFVLYRKTRESADKKNPDGSEQTKDVYRLSGVCFWQMPEKDIPEAQRCYDEMRRRVRAGQAENAVKSTENRCCHVRPHGRNAKDTDITPDGRKVKKQAFWLNQKYLKEQIEEALKA